MGITYVPNYLTNPYTPPRRSHDLTPKRSNNNPEVFNVIDCQKSLFNWQRRIFDKVLNQKNIFVSVAPSAGKTRPLNCAIVYKIRDTFTRFNTLNHIKFLWVTPLVQLNYQMYEEAANILSQAILSFPELFDYYRPIFNIAIHTDNFNVNKYDDIYKGVLTLVGADAGAVPPGAKRPDQSTIIDICTYEKAALYESKFKYTMVIIDEFQEAFNANPTDSKIKAYERLFGTKSQTVCLSGSTNKYLIDEFVQFSKYRWDKEYDILSFTARFNSGSSSAAGNRSHITLLPVNWMSINLKNDEINHIKHAIINILNTKSSNNLFILFSKKAIYYLCESIIKDLPIINKDPFKNTKFSIRKDIDDSIYLYLANFAKQYNVNIDDVSDDEFVRLWHNVNFLKYLAKKGISEEVIDRINRKSFIFRCIQRGIGFIVGGSRQVKYVDRFLILTNEEKEIVSKLFINGTIKVLLSTEAVGIGVNLKVRNLYIPTVWKFDGSHMTKNDLSSMMQLIHRAGRGSFSNATIYCHPDDFEYINCLLTHRHDVAVSNKSDMSQFKSIHPRRKFKLMMMEFGNNVGLCDSYL